MIYFLDNDLQLQKIVTSKNIISAVHEHELNGLIIADIVLDLSYANKFLILGIDHVGYYYKDEFYLHKIQSVEYNHTDETALVELRHVFFEDMLFGKLIQDVRPQNQDAPTVLRQTIDANTRWQTVMTDVTGRLSTNFYWQVPYEVIEFVTENYRVEYIPKILFDGQKINGFQLHVANKVGEDKNIRIPFGSRVLDLKYEEDYSEIITKLVGHGKGEEVGDGYGRRINISDVNFNRNGVESPVGDVYMEDETITATYGNDGQTPREGRVIFEDIENINELAEATYQYYLDVSRPQMLFTADVADIGDVGIGDSVMIIRREYDVYFKARIHKLTVDLLYPEDAQVELGDYEHFKESKISRKAREKNNRLHKRNQSEIERLKREFDENFEAAVEQFRSEFEQAKIDIFAEIEADRIRMEELIDTTRNEWTEEFTEEMDESYRKAEENYEAIKGEITTKVDTARAETEAGYNAAVAEAQRQAEIEHARISGEVITSIDTARQEVEQGYTDAVEQAKQFAEQQAAAHAEAVQSNLDSVTRTHQDILNSLERDVINIDNFLGDSRSITLDERFQQITLNFENQLRDIDSTHFNIIRGTSFDEPELIAKHSSVEIITNETDNFVRMGLGTTAVPYVMPTEYFNVEAGQKYNLMFSYRTEDVPEIDYIRLRPPLDFGGDLAVESLVPIESLRTDMSGHWTKMTVTFVADRDMPVRLLLGTNFGANNTTRGILDIKKPYLTTTNNREWLPHPDDATQNVSEIVRRVTQLEDGRRELITRSEYDFDTGQLNQYIKSVEETVEGSQTILQRVEDWQATNGASIEETIYGFDQKVWLNDVANIGANLIPLVSGAWERGNISITTGQPGVSTTSIRTKDYIDVSPSTEYTLSDNSTYLSEIARVDVHQYSVNNGWIANRFIERGNKVTFTTWSNTVKVRLAITAISGFSLLPIEIERTSEVKLKLEVGATATPMLNAISRIEQLANSVSIQVQELDGDFLSQSDIQVHPGYVQLGSQRLGDSQLASIFRVSPNSIDAITDSLNLTGNLNVKGQIESISMSAVKAEFADLFSARVRAGSVHADYVEGFAARFENLYTLNANIERLVAQHVFSNAVTAKSIQAIEGEFSSLFAAELEATTILARHISSNAIQARHLLVSNAMVEKIVANNVYADDVTTKSLNAIEANIGRVRAAFLIANVIESDHIQVGTALVNKLFASSARIDELITKKHFTDNIFAMSIEAVEGQFSSLITRYLSANYIDVDYINGKNAWFETQYTSNAMIRKLTAQTAFIRDVQAIEITANQLNLTTLKNRFNQIEGGINITRTDGVVWVENGVPRGNVPVQTYDSYAGANIEFNGLNYITDYSHWQTFKYFYTPHEGRTLRVVWAVGLIGSSGSASEYVEVGIEGFGGNNPINNGAGSSTRRVFVQRGATEFVTQDIPLPRPTYNMMQAYIQVRRSPTGTGVTNRVFARILHIGQYH